MKLHATWHQHSTNIHVHKVLKRTMQIACKDLEQQLAMLAVLTMVGHACQTPGLTVTSTTLELNQQTHCTCMCSCKRMSECTKISELYTFVKATETNIMARNSGCNKLLCMHTKTVTVQNNESASFVLN